MPARPEWPTPRALAWLYCPPPQQGLLEGLFALEAELSHSLRPGLDHQVAHARLAYWREECERTARGRPGHPLTQALAVALCDKAGTALGGLAGLVDTATWDLAAATFETRAELEAYCARWSAALLAPLAHAALAREPAGSRALGCALRELELLHALAAEARAGRVRLPLAELDAAGVPVAALAQPPWPEALVRLLRARHGQLRLALAAAVGSLGAAEQAGLRGLMVWARILGAHSQRLMRALPRAPLSGDHRGALDGWQAWRAARRAAAGRLRLPP
jgi:phytoene synthase